MNGESVSVRFYENAEGKDIKYSVIVSRMSGKFILCRHRKRGTFEVPGGHIEEGETPLDAARRELYEETGAVDFVLTPVCIYGVKRAESESYGALFYADVKEIGALPESEIAISEVVLFDEFPKDPEILSYPLIQPLLTQKALKGREL